MYTEQHKLYMREYRKTPQFRAYMKRYKKEYWQLPHFKKQRNKYQQEYRKKNGYPKRDKLTEWSGYLKWRWKMTSDDYLVMVNRQKGKCAICKCHYSTFKKRLAIDHDHKTGKIRGLLCHHCNSALGNFRDRICILVSAIKYLEEWK
jgi:hypothetical protein